MMLAGTPRYRGSAMRTPRGTIRLWAASGLALAGAAGLVSCSGDEPHARSQAETTTPAPRAALSDAAVSFEGVSFEVHNDPGCGCCKSWAEYMAKHGAAVTLSEDPQRDAFRAGVGIGDDAASCHTAVVDGYAIEGHVPAAAIAKLLDERPDAAGLALPGMPMDSPGMGGDAAAWAELPVMLVGADGSLTPYAY